MPPFNVQRIDHAVLRVRDTAASVSFYSQILGMSVVKERPDLGLTHLRAGDSMLDLVQLDGPLGLKGGEGPGSSGRNVDHLCLKVEPFDFETIRSHLLDHGIQAPEPAQIRFGAEGEGWSIYIRDPDGNTIELKGPSGTK